MAKVVIHDIPMREMRLAAGIGFREMTRLLNIDMSKLHRIETGKGYIQEGMYMSFLNIITKKKHGSEQKHNRSSKDTDTEIAELRATSGRKAKEVIRAIKKGRRHNRVSGKNAGTASKSGKSNLKSRK